MRSIARLFMSSVRWSSSDNNEMSLTNLEASRQASLITSHDSQRLFTVRRADLMGLSTLAARDMDVAGALTRLIDMMDS